MNGSARRWLSVPPGITGPAFIVLSAWVLWVSPATAQQAVKSPHGKLPDGLDCAACHTPEGWHTLKSRLGFDHARSGFALTGAHTQVACARCHLDLRFDGPAIKADDCGGCHADVHQGRMIQSCSECHNTRSFKDVDGDMIHQRTRFPLTGAHRQISCVSCHKTDVGGAFTSLPTDCASCHIEDYRGAKSVDHVAAGYPTDCTQCHTTVDWHDAPSFDHAKVSRGFELVGAHASLRCASCHQVPGLQPLFNPTSQNDCVACHLTDYDRAHSGSGFPTTCTSCHNVNTWDDANFDHSATNFPLVGAHASLACSRCHSASNDLSKLPTGPDDCVACHQADYDKAHSGSGIPTTCSGCHTTSSWDGATADHALLSGGFTLSGPHATAQCTACHAVPGYTLLFPKPSSPNDCVACHQADYDKAHGGSGFPTTCTSCHQPDTWSGATVDHAQISGGFQLVGAHATAPCTSCHVVPGYTLKFPTPASSNDCVTCHRADFTSAHGSLGFPTDCTTCHNTTAWTPSSFDHDAQYFPIYSGSHQSVWTTCATCHTTPSNFASFTCTDCHTKSTTDGHHTDVRNYVYESSACYSCHPRGRSD